MYERELLLTVYGETGQGASPEQAICGSLRNDGCRGRYSQNRVGVPMRNKRAYGKEQGYSTQERRPAPSRQVVFKSVARDRTARAETELTVDGTHMGVDCMRTDDELCGNLSVGEPLGH